MIKMSLPLPTTVADDRRSGTYQCRPALSKRSLKLIVACALVLVTLSLYSFSSSFGTGSHRIDIDALERVLTNASPTVIGANKPEPEHNAGGLTVLGLEADESFHLGSTAVSEYRTELEDFVTKAFPAKYQEDALASIRRHLNDTDTQTSFSPIPQKYVSISSLSFDTAHSCSRGTILVAV
jgi:hypothetical protein